MKERYLFLSPRMHSFFSIQEHQPLILLKMFHKRHYKVVDLDQWLRSLALMSVQIQQQTLLYPQ